MATMSEQYAQRCNTKWATHIPIGNFKKSVATCFCSSILGLGRNQTTEWAHCGHCIINRPSKLLRPYKRILVFRCGSDKQREIPVSDTLADILSRTIGKLQSDSRETLLFLDFASTRAFFVKLLPRRGARRVIPTYIVGESQDAALLSNQSKIGISISLMVAGRGKWRRDTTEGISSGIEISRQHLWLCSPAGIEKDFHKVIGEAFLACSRRR